MASEFRAEQMTDPVGIDGNGLPLPNPQYEESADLCAERGCYGNRRRNKVVPRKSSRVLIINLIMARFFNPKI